MTYINSLGFRSQGSITQCPVVRRTVGWTLRVLAFATLFGLVACRFQGQPMAEPEACRHPNAAQAGADDAMSPPNRLDAEQVRALLLDLKVMNYYPAGNAWTYMWSRWDEATIDNDFGRIGGLGANVVRVIVHPHTFGYPEPETHMLDRLHRTVELADAHGLRVQLTLFDWWLDYGEIGPSQQWLMRVLEPYQHDPRVVFIELQNEMDASDPVAVQWAREMVPCARAIVGATPITISVSGTAGVEGLQRLVDADLALDFYDLHYYRKAALALATFRRARDVVGTVPLRLGEVGYATNLIADQEPYLADQIWREYAQDQYFRTIQEAARVAGLPTAAPWLLDDLLPGAIPPTSSASNPAQYAFGLYRTNGSEKTAVAGVRSAFTGAVIDERFNNGFEAGSTQYPANWQIWQGDLAEFARDMTVAHRGSASVSISRSSATTEGYPAFYTSPVKPISPEGFYTATVWSKGRDATGSTRIALAWFDATGSFLGNTSSADLPQGTTDWQQLVVSARAPSDAAMVEIHLVSANNSGTVWFDDVTFE